MYVYFIKSSKAIKIGISDNPQLRLSAIQTSNHDSLALVYSIECQDRNSALRLESMLHTRYSQYHVHGEWFSVDPNMIISDIEFGLSLSELSIGRHIYKTEIVKTIEKVKKAPFYMRWLAQWKLAKIEIEKMYGIHLTSSKSSPKLMEAVGWLKINDPDGKLSFRDAAEKSGVSVGTIQNARKHLQQNKGQ